MKAETSGETYEHYFRKTFLSWSRDGFQMTPNANSNKIPEQFTLRKRHKKILNHHQDTPSLVRSKNRIRFKYKYLTLKISEKS